MSVALNNKIWCIADDVSECTKILRKNGNRVGFGIRLDDSNYIASETIIRRLIHLRPRLVIRDWGYAPWSVMMIFLGGFFPAWIIPSFLRLGFPIFRRRHDEHHDVAARRYMMAVTTSAMETQSEPRRRLS